MSSRGRYSINNARRVKWNGTGPSEEARQAIIEAMMEAWKDGTSFIMELDDDGVVKARRGRTIIHRFDNMGQCISSLFPDVEV